MITNYQNEVIKRKYEKYLKEANGLVESSIRIALSALSELDEFCKGKDYGCFISTEQAIAFKEWLRGKTKSLTGYTSKCKQVQKFFRWLHQQKGFHNKITVEVIDYLNLSKKDKALARCGKIKNIPTLAYVKKLISTIPPDTEVNKRDRALIAFTCLTGARESALVSLPIMAVNIEKMFVEQNPLDGVKTKFTKHITSKIFNFDEDLVKCVKEWYQVLQTKGFKPTDPFFPQSKPLKIEGNLSFMPSVEVIPSFWNNGGIILKIFSSRAKKANMEYYSPHRYRDLAIRLALGKARNGGEIKAISQNFGHEYVATTLASYANYRQDQLIQKLSEIDNRKEIKGEDSETLRKIKQLISGEMI